MESTIYIESSGEARNQSPIPGKVGENGPKTFFSAFAESPIVTKKTGQHRHSGREGAILVTVFDESPSERASQYLSQ